MTPNRDALADAHALAVLGVPAPTIRWWAQRGWLHQQGKAGRRVLYRVGDVLDLQHGACRVDNHRRAGHHHSQAQVVVPENSRL